MARRGKRYTPGNMKVTEAYYSGESYELNERSIARSNKGKKGASQNVTPRDVSGRFTKIRGAGKLTTG